MNTEINSLLHWNYFLALDDDAANISRYIEFKMDNYNTYSIELARIIMIASSEVDVVAKMICKKLNPDSDANNINNYREMIVPVYPKLYTYKIDIPRYGIGLVPWQKWEEGVNPDWWMDYNSIKHQRDQYYKKANLKNALNSIAALYVMLLYYYIDEAKNAKLNPMPSIFMVSKENIANRIFGEDGLTIKYLV